MLLLVFITNKQNLQFFFIFTYLFCVQNALTHPTTNKTKQFTL